MTIIILHPYPCLIIEKKKHEGNYLLMEKKLFTSSGLQTNTDYPIYFILTSSFSLTLVYEDEEFQINESVPGRKIFEGLRFDISSTRYIDIIADISNITKYRIYT